MVLLQNGYNMMNDFVVQVYGKEQSALLPQQPAPPSTAVSSFGTSEMHNVAGSKGCMPEKNNCNDEQSVGVTGRVEPVLPPVAPATINHKHQLPSVRLQPESSLGGKELAMVTEPNSHPNLHPRSHRSPGAEDHKQTEAPIVGGKKDANCKREWSRRGIKKRKNAEDVDAMTADALKEKHKG